MQERKDVTTEEVEEENQLIFMNNTITVGRSIEVGNIGAHSWKDEKSGKKKKGEENDHHLVEFLELPRTEQNEETEGSAWTVECKFLNPVPSAPLWFTPSSLKVTVEVCKVVATNLQMQPMSETDQMKSRNKKLREEAKQKNAMKLPEESHEFILNEIRRREIVEHDPGRVFVEAEDDSESDEDEEEE